MRHRTILVVILLVAGLVVSAGALRSSVLTPTDPDGLVVHEWGTFTSVSGEDGTPVEWLPPIGPQELPCFVERLPFSGKGWLPATVRMETPVLYFYSPADRDVDVTVKFKRGLITEWYPPADVTPKLLPLALRSPSLEGAITWKQIKVRPRSAEKPLTGSKANHYYAARETDAAILDVRGEREKFLFYRGIANFAPPMTARLTKDGRVVVTPAANQAVADVVLFDNRDGAVTHTSAQPNSKELTIDVGAQASSREAVSATLEALLIKHGLYPREAAAMVATWRDSWFEDGLRLFYVVPRSAVDDILPLDVAPVPTNVARVFVGRIELLTPRILDTVRTAMRDRNREPIVKYGRFLQPIVARVGGTDSPEWKKDLEFAYSVASPPPGGCR